MCRILSYLGKPILLEELLYKPDNSFIKQSYHPRYMSHLLNLAGFGMISWDKASYNAQKPFIYKTTHLPFYDENLRNISSKITPYCLLTHLRGVSYTENQTVSEQNVHPFMFDNSHFALAHNGVLVDFENMKYDLLDFILPEYQSKIHGTTDSEWIYAVFISQLPKDVVCPSAKDISHAVHETLKIIKQIRIKHHIEYNSPVNLFITNGKFIAATRFVFDYGWPSPEIEHLAHFSYHSLWYTYGDTYGLHGEEYRMLGNKTRASIIIASEPLTTDTTTWIELPEYTLIIANLEDDEIRIVSEDIKI